MGIVVTGGGSQLRHITQLFEYLTGMDARIGYPTEHLASSNSIENLTSPIYSTGIGLVLKGFESLEKSEAANKKLVQTEPTGVKGHSKDDGKKGGFFDKILKATKDFIKEDEE
jgi:cell division protein FtsA